MHSSSEHSDQNMEANSQVQIKRTAHAYTAKSEASSTALLQQVQTAHVHCVYAAWAVSSSWPHSGGHQSGRQGVTVASPAFSCTLPSAASRPGFNLR